MGRRAVLLCLMWLVMPVFPEVCAAEQSTEPPIRIVVTPFLNYAPFFIAQEEGYFAEQGLAVEMVRLTNNMGALPALITGDVDVISSIIYPSLFNAIRAGSKVRLVADRGHVGPGECSWYSFIVRKSLAESTDLDRGDWLRGARYALNGPSSPHAYLADRLLNTYGLSLQDIETVGIPVTARISAFESGAIDFTLANEPWIVNSIDSGQVVEWKPLASVVPSFQQSAVQFGPRLLEQDVDAG